MKTNDVSLGFGPEVAVFGASQVARNVRVQMVRRGPQGFALGKVAVVAHDGTGTLRFDDRAFVLMNEGAAVPLGTLRADAARSGR